MRNRLHQLELDELSEAELLVWSRGCVDGVSVRSEGVHRPARIEDESKLGRVR